MCVTQFSKIPAIVVALALSLPGTPSAQEDRASFWPATTASPPDLPRLISDAAAAAQTGKRDALREACEGIQAIEPDGPGTRYCRATDAAMSGKYGEARTALELLLEESTPQIPDEFLHRDLGGVLALTGDLAGARDSHLRAARIAPGTREHFYFASAGAAAMGLGDLVEAERSYRRALQAAPTYTQALFGMALVLERQGAHQDARGYLLEGLIRDRGAMTFLSSRAQFTPRIERAFAAGLIAEELGQAAEARAHLEEFIAAKGVNPRFADTARQALARVETTGPTIVASGPLPLRNITAAAADPKGRFLALGNKDGALVTARLDAQKVIATPLLAGPALVALAFSRGGDTLLSADNAGNISVFSTRRRLTHRATRGPAALPGGTLVVGFSSDGERVLLTSPSGSTVRVADAVTLRAIGAPSKRKRRPPITAVGPWSDRHGGLDTAVWTRRQTLVLAREPGRRAVREIKVPNPLPDRGSSTQWEAVTITDDGRRIILARRSHLAVCRAADGKILRLVNLGVDAKLGRVNAIVVDSGGAAGHGSALIALHERGYRAINLQLLVPPR
jgi:tetratricopeptide (TPR) repeat protein